MARSGFVPIANSLFFLLMIVLLTNTNSLYFFVVDGRVFTQDLRVVHVRDLNFVLRSEIFVHWDW